MIASVICRRLYDTTYTKFRFFSFRVGEEVQQRPVQIRLQIVLIGALFELVRGRFKSAIEYLELLSRCTGENSPVDLGA